MKLHCNGLELADALSNVIKAAPTNKNIPILEGIKLKTDGDKLVLTATDNELSIKAFIKADIHMDGEAVVPGKFFSEFMRKLTLEDVELDDNNLDGKMSVRYNKNESKVALLRAVEFPVVSDAVSKMNFNVPQRELKKIISNTLFAADSGNITRPVLNGCLWEIKDGRLTAVAMDGYRLAIYNSQLPKNACTAKVIVPQRTLKELAHLLKDSDEAVTVHIDNNRIMFDAGDIVVNSSLITGEYPDYNLLRTSATGNNVVLAAKEDLQRGVDRASIISRQAGSNLVKIDVTEEQMTINSRSEIGNISEIVPVKLQGQDVAVGLNIKYLDDCLKVIEDEIICIRLGSSKAPIVISAEDGGDYFFMIVPMRMSV